MEVKPHSGVGRLHVRSLLNGQLPISLAARFDGRECDGECDECDGGVRWSELRKSEFGLLLMLLKGGSGAHQRRARGCCRLHASRCSNGRAFSGARGGLLPHS